MNVFPLSDSTVRAEPEEQGRRGAMEAYVVEELGGNFRKTGLPIPAIGLIKF